MNVHGQVNAYLQSARYSSSMARAGAKKGKPKPPKRVLDSGFVGRLKSAMVQRDWDLPRLAREARCTRQVLHKYLKRGGKTVEAHLLLDMAEALRVSARWLLTGHGAMDRPTPLTPDHQRVIELFSLLNEGNRDLWLSQGEEIKVRQPSLMPTTADPYPAAPRAKAKA